MISSLLQISSIKRALFIDYIPSVLLRASVNFLGERSPSLVSAKTVRGTILQVEGVRLTREWEVFLMRLQSRAAQSTVLTPADKQPR